LLCQYHQITDADRAALMALCLEWARYLNAEAKVRVQGMVVMTPSGYPMQNPYLPIVHKSLRLCIPLWAELGLTPSSRSRVKTDGSGPPDAFAEFDTPLPLTGKPTEH
jgi:P27 family predicted phage terminase small subunit